MLKNNTRRSAKRWFFVLLGVAILAACEAGSSGAIPAQEWQGMEVRVESRPNPPRVGMNEFLVMVTDRRGRPGYDWVISLRASDQDEWKQAIEDGQVGVYRRAVKVEEGVAPTLQVQLRRGTVSEVLYFDLLPPAS